MFSAKLNDTGSSSCSYSLTSIGRGIILTRSDQLGFFSLPPHLSNAFPEGYWHLWFFSASVKTIICDSCHFYPPQFRHRLLIQSTLALTRGRCTETCTALTTPSLTFPNPVLSLLALERLQGPSHCHTKQRERSPISHPPTQKSHLFIWLRNESQAELPKTRIMAVKINCALLAICQETKKLQFSPNGFPISYTEFGHIFTIPEAPLEILPNLKSQPHLTD